MKKEDKNIIQSQSKPGVSVSKSYTKEETVEVLAKAMYKMMEKALKSRKKDVIEDVLDPNFEAEVDPDKVPTTRSGVLWKKDTKKKGVNKLKLFVKQRKK